VFYNGYSIVLLIALLYEYSFLDGHHFLLYTAIFFATGAVGAKGFPLQSGVGGFWGL
jgi:hypothetical protein